MYEQVGIGIVAIVVREHYIALHPNLSLIKRNDLWHVEQVEFLKVNISLQRNFLPIKIAFKLCIKHEIWMA